MNFVGDLKVGNNKHIIEILNEEGGEEFQVSIIYY